MLVIPPPRDSGFTTTTSVPLYWCAYGRPGARRLLVLHGGPGADHRYLLPQLLELGDEHELVFYDQRGGGQSRTDDPAPITWQTHVEDFDAIARELGLVTREIVGYSWGGLLAMLSAIESTIESTRSSLVARPSSLVLIDPAPINRAFRHEFEAEFARRQQGPEVLALRDELARSGLRERDPAAYRHRAFELSVAGYFADPRAARELTPFRVTGRVQQSVWESLGDFDLAPDLARLRTLGIPTLVVHGREDPIPLASSEAAAGALGAELVVLERCGHVPYVERPEELFRAIDAFLRALPAR